MENQKAYKKAKIKIEAKFSFYIHLAICVGVCIFLYIINIITSPDGYLWVKWVFLGWGIGLFFHGLAVFFFIQTAPIKERMIREEMKKELAKNSDSD